MAMLCNSGRGLLCDLWDGRGFLNADGKQNHAHARARIKQTCQCVDVCQYDHVIISHVRVYHLLALLLLGAVRPAPALLEAAVAATDSLIHLLR